MKILLLNLPKDGEVKDFTTPDYLMIDFVSYPPLGLISIATGVDSRHSLKVLDTVVNKMDINEAVEYINDYKPDLLGMTVVTGRLYAMYTISKRVKELLPKIKIIVGGPHVSSFPKETIELGPVDYALTGYGEQKFPLFVELLDKIQSGDELVSVMERIPGLYYKVNGFIKVNLPDKSPVCLDELPFPNRKLLNLESYYSAADKAHMTTINTSRGCPFRCTYCDIPEKSYHYRSAKKIVDEFQNIVEMGIKTIFIFDDTFNINRQRVIGMCEEILKRKLDIVWSARARIHPFDKEMLTLMKEAGCRRLHVGVESLDANILKIIKKQITLEQIHNFFSLCNELKIDTLSYFIIGFPEETSVYRATLYKRIMELKPTYIYVNILYPATTSEFYQSLLKQGVYEKDFWKEFVKNPVPDFEVPLFRSLELQRELFKVADEIHRKFYFSTQFIYNDLKRNFSFETIGVKARGAIKLLYKTTVRKYIRHVTEK